MNSPITLVPQPVALAQNQILEYEQTALQNPFRTGMWVDCFRFRVLDARAQFGLRIDIKLGRTAMTNGLVPIGIVSPIVQEFGGFGPVIAGTPQVVARGQFDWVLERPLYVPPTEQLIVKAQWVLPLTESPINVYCAVAARSCGRDEPVPEVVHYPWAASFITTSQTAGAYVTQQSAETDLNNPFNEPMKVYRFMGRGFQTTPIGINESVFSEMQAGTSIRTLVSAADHKGTIMIKNPTPFQNVFNPSLRSFSVRGAVLPPKGFYLFRVEQDYRDVVSGMTNQQFAIGINGYREVRLR